MTPLASIDADSGNLVAKGPGKVLSYQLNDPNKPNRKFAGFSRSRPDTDKSKDRSKPAKKINCVHVNFDGELAANSTKNEMLISGNVRTAYSDVNKFEENVDPDQESLVLPTGGVTIHCDKLQTAQWQPRGSAEPTTEIIATGNVHVKNQLFESTAQRLTYSETTDVMTIEGSQRSNARLVFRSTAKSKPNQLVAEKIMYRLSDQWTNVQSMKNLDITRPAR